MSFELIAFDADDTLWDCQGHFDAVEKEYCEILSPYGSGEEISKALFETETGNMSMLGFGSKAFTISLVENAIKVSRGKACTADIVRIINLGKSLLQLPATPLPEVRETLQALKGKGKYKMVVFTKGDNQEQEGKYRRSGLAEFFDDIVVVADKTRREYMRLCRLFDTDISHLCMVGNSYKSDILPVLQLGGYAVHIPYKLIWKMEQADEAPHPRMRKIESFGQLSAIIDNPLFSHGF